MFRVTTTLADQIIKRTYQASELMAGFGMAIELESVRGGVDIDALGC